LLHVLIPPRSRGHALAFYFLGMQNCEFAPGGRGGPLCVGELLARGR